MKFFLLGLLLGVIILPVGAYVYLNHGRPPVAVGDQAFPMEARIVHIPLNARIDAEMPKASPIEASATNLEMGAHIYRQQCAACHGLYGRPSSFGPQMYPRAPQLWEPHGQGVVGVSDDPPGETYWKVANGIRLTGMPSFSKVLNETEMWQVTMLLATADKPVPAQVLDSLKRPLYDTAETDANPSPLPPAK